jgi:hypothetical protein
MEQLTFSKKEEFAQKFLAGAAKNCKLSSVTNRCRMRQGEQDKECAPNANSGRGPHCHHRERRRKTPKNPRKMSPGGKNKRPLKEYYNMRHPYWDYSRAQKKQYKANIANKSPKSKRSYRKRKASGSRPPTILVEEDVTVAADSAGNMVVVEEIKEKDCSYYKKHGGFTKMCTRGIMEGRCVKPSTNCNHKGQTNKSPK